MNEGIPATGEQAGQWIDCSHYWTTDRGQCLLCGHHGSRSIESTKGDRI